MLFRTRKQIRPPQIQEERRGRLPTDLWDSFVEDFCENVFQGVRGEFELRSHQPPEGEH